MELRFSENEDNIIENDYISEITAVFTTSNARVRLYKMLDWLDPSQVNYCDTDSVIFKYDADNPKHKSPYVKKDIEDARIRGIEFGTGLGQWEDELKGQDYITELVIGGAKSYGYKTKNGKISIKQKGITLSRDNEEIINFDTFKEMVLNDTKLETKPRHQFRWEERSKDVIIKYIAKVIRPTIGEKRVKTKNHNTLPFGGVETPRD